MSELARSCRIGIDLGGTKIEGVLLGSDGQVLERKRVPTPGGDYAAILDAIRALVSHLEHGLDGPVSVGIGTPGSISLKTGRLRNSNTLCLNGMPLREDLSRVLEREVRIANDADCMTLSEATDGAAAGIANVFGVILGTGVGGGICVNGRLLQGINAIAGEWGHTTLPLAAYRSLPAESRIRSPQGRRECFCGRIDCVETHLSGPALERSYAELTGRAVAGSRIVALAREGEPIAAALLIQYGNLLALALSTVINILDPEVIVLAGGLSNVEELYISVPATWGRYVFSDQVRTRLVRSLHGDSSGVRGAAWLWPGQDG